MNPAERPELSVVIVTYNAARVIGDCLDSLRRDGHDLALEVFVVDNGSRDGTPALLRERHGWVQLHDTGRNLGFSAGNNLALPLCRGRHVMLLNPDTIVQPGALRALLGHLRAHPEVGAAGPKLRLGDGRIQTECARNLPQPGNLLPWLLLLDKLGHRLRLGRGPAAASGVPPGHWFDRFNLLDWPRARSCSVQSICGACILLRHDVLQQVGLLDEASPMYLDDIDYCRRILDAGWQIHYVAEATVTHLWQQSTLPERAGLHYALGLHALWLYLGKHHGPGAAQRFAAMVLLVSLVRLPPAVLAAAWPGAGRPERVRRLRMAQGLWRWAWRFPKSPPQLGFDTRVAP
jgi:GT2 family glycosyltransferase